MNEPVRSGARQPSAGQQTLVLRLAFVIIVLVSALAFYSTLRLISASKRVERSQAVLIDVNRYLSEIKDVESRSRAYYVTGDEDIRRRRESSLASLRQSAERLGSIDADDELRQRLSRLSRTAEERVAFSNRLMELRGKPDEAVRTIRLGSDLMDRLRDESEDIITRQTRTYQAEQQKLQGQAWLTSLALAIGVALCLGAIAWLFAIRGREVERRRRLEEELRSINVELEDRVQQRTAEVSRASKLLDAVVENIPDMVLLKEPSGEGFRYLLINAAGEKLLGRSRDRIVGRTETDLFPAEESAQIVEANRRVAASGEPQVLTDRTLTTASGTRTVETRMVPIANGSGETALILAIVRDVSEAKRREEQVRQLQRMDAIGRLTGGVAHDFNNLLAIIHGNSELVRDRLEAGTDLAEMTDDVIGAAARGAELVKRLLAFARMQHLEPASVDLGERIPNVIGLLQRALSENVQLQVRMAEELWPAIIDPTQVDDALLNLAINSRDAMPDGGTLTIETQNVHLDEDYAAHHVEVAPGDYVMLAVSDTGTGMEPEVLARAFDPFFTTKEEGQGTGLGLSQVFGWVKQSGGHIKIYSEVGHGTTIKLYLPRAVEEGAVAAAPAEPVPPGGNETILVVEDNANVRKTVVRQLHDLGYRSVEAESGASALELVAEGLSFDLLLTDVVMPGGMTGYQLADQLRRTRPDTRVLFTSGYTELARSADQLSRRDSLLSKPYRKQDLGRAVRRALDQPRHPVEEL